MFLNTCSNIMTNLTARLSQCLSRLIFAHLEVVEKRCGIPEKQCINDTVQSTLT